MIAKKGQLEILGLAIVMVILLFGFIIFLRFTSEPPAPAQNFFFTELPSQTLDTLIGTTTDCRDLKIGTLIADVASHTSSPSDPLPALDQLIWCDHPRNPMRSFPKLFDATDGIIPYLLEETLTEASITYDFSVRFKDNVQIWPNPETNNCGNARRVDAETFLIQSDNGPVEVTMKIC